MYRHVVYKNSFVVIGRRYQVPYYAAGRFYIYVRQVTLLSQIMYKVPTQVHWFPLVYLGRTNRTCGAKLLFFCQASSPRADLLQACHLAACKSELADLVRIE